MMDIGTENGLPDPHGGVEQPQFPWRGRITCDPAPQQAGTPDRTIAARQQVETFLGTVSADKFVQTREGCLSRHSIAVVLSADDSALCPSGRCGRWRGYVSDRLGIEGADFGARRW